MRGFLLCCLVALATCESISYEPSLNPRKTYEYKYEGVVNIGRIVPNLAEAGVKLACKVKIIGVNDKTFLLQLLDPAFEEFNGYPGKAAFTAVPKLTQAIAAQLVKPFMFEYSKGHVGDIHAPAEASDTTVNIVRGILDFLQVTVKTTQRVYQLEEIGIHGMCLSNYAISDNSETKDLTITQVIDVNACKEKAAVYKGMAFAVVDKISKERGESVFSTVRRVYTIKPTPAGGVITKSETLEQQHFTPFNVKGGTVKMQAIKELVLLSEIDTVENHPVGPLENKGNIVFKFVDELANIPILMQNEDNPVPKILELIKSLARANIYQVDSATSQDIIKVYQLLRLVPFEDIDAMWKQLAANDEHRRWFLDMIVELTDARVLRFLELRFKARDVSVNEAGQTLLMALEHLQALPELVEMAKEFFALPFSRSNPYLWQTVALAYGSLVNKLCANETPCPVSAVQPLLDMALDGLQKRSETDMVIALKALGNAGHPASIKTIMRFLPGVGATPVDLPPRVLSAAVQSMRLIAGRDPQKVQDITMTLFVQDDLPAEIRMLAFMILFQTKPPLALVSTVAAHVLQEKDLQVASFAFSTLRSLSRSSTPDNHYLSIACNVAVKILARKFGRLSYRYSQASIMDWFNDDFLLGTATEVVMLRSVTNIFPTELMVKGKFYFIGRILQLLELGVRTDGLKDLFDANIPGFKGDLSYTDFLAVIDAIQGWEAVPEEKPLLSVYSRAFSQEWFFADLNRKMVQDALKAFSISAGRESPVWGAIENLQRGISWHWTKPFLIFETRYIQATTLGLPLEISKYYGSVTAITVNAKAKINPPLVQRLGELLASEITLETDGFIGVTKDHWFYYGINTDLFQSGAELKSKSPIAVPWKFTTKINIKEKKFELDTPPCLKETEFVAVNFNIYAVSRNSAEPDLAKMTPMMPNIIESNDKVTPVRKENVDIDPVEMLPEAIYHPKTKLCAESNVYGAGLCVEAEAKRAYYQQEYPLYYVLGYTHFALKLVPVHPIRPVDKVHIAVNAGPNRHPMNLSQLLENLRSRSKAATQQMQLYSGSAANSTGSAQGWAPTPEAVLNIQALAISGALKPQGFDAALYYTPEAHVENGQLIVSQVAEEANWKLCTDASVDKALAEAKVHMRWGAECQSYELSMKAATSHLPGARPTLKTNIRWGNIPDSMAWLGKSIEDYIPGTALFLGFSQQHERNANQELFATFVVTTADSFNVKIKLPELTVYRLGIPMPFQVTDFQEVE